MFHKYFNNITQVGNPFLLEIFRLYCSSRNDDNLERGTRKIIRAKKCRAEIVLKKSNDFVGIKWLKVLPFSSNKSIQH